MYRSERKPDEAQPLINEATRDDFSSTAEYGGDTSHIPGETRGKLKGWMGVLFVAVVVLGQAAQNLSIPLWIHYLPESDCQDPFVSFLIMILWYPVMFFFTSIAANLYAGRPMLSHLSRYTRSQHWTIIKTGLCDALNGAILIPASPSDRTPPLIAALIGATTLLPLIILKHFYLLGWGRDKWKHYGTQAFFTVFVLYCGATYSLVYPTARADSQVGDKVYWWLIFFVGSCFGQFYNVQQEKFFKTHRHMHQRFVDFSAYLFWQTFYLMVWGYLLIWLDVIPGFGAAKNAADLQCNLSFMMSRSFQSTSLIWNVVFNVGYYFTYIAACFVNTTDALVGTVATVLVTAIVTIVSYPIPELTPPDAKSAIAIGLVPLTIILSAAAMYSYVKWSTQTGIYEGH